MGRKRKTPARRVIQLELFPVVALPAPVTGLWKQVQELPETIARLERERKKLVPRKLKQPELISHGALEEALVAAPPPGAPRQVAARRADR